MRPCETLPTRRKILHYLKTEGPRTAGWLAERLDVTTMAIRQHLDKLVEDGMVDHFDRRQKVGRPARYWNLTERASDEFPDSHGDLSAELLESMRAAFGDDAMSRLIEERKRSQYERYRERMPGADAPLADRVAALSDLRDEEGYMAEWCSGDAEAAGVGDGKNGVNGEDDGDALYLIENHCPICTAARTCSGLCDGELTLFRELLEPASVERVEHVLGEDRRCVYRVRPAGGPGSS